MQAALSNCQDEMKVLLDVINLQQAEIENLEKDTVQPAMEIFTDARKKLEKAEEQLREAKRLYEVRQKTGDLTVEDIQKGLAKLKKLQEAAAKTIQTEETPQE